MALLDALALARALERCPEDLASALERYARVVLRALDGAASRPLVAVADMPVGG